ncbi:hypothetical protein PLESTB_001385500 [Pleodorina starrii]|uniref:Uncharacterized protein n=1 Tax=Pleodorina starrii TaxID=330485 RepID=A0A9W6F649_9CHLO|nr:hypothetical protein PLESTM_000946700 [Pleodorina starrii]GLC57734.1 hypothetical protein PLESTB_001258900 [Pleodorina starrii]GLC58661.1 hypothetical protein PLESTB_001385500 [Pleodorina starrii]
MGAGCCKADVELNPDNTPKDPQTKEQRKEDGKELRRAALAADWALMRTLLRRMPLRQICSGAGKDEAGEDDLGNTALHYSVSINHMRGVKKLLRYGMPPHLVNKAGKTPLHMALEAGKLKAAKALLDKSMEASKTAQNPPKSLIINAQDSKGVTPLLTVVAAGRLKLAREVLGICKELEMRIDYDVVDSEGNSLVLFAAKWGWFDELATWIDHLTNPRKILNVLNKEGETVLGHVLMFRASGLLEKERALKLVTRLIELGALPKLPSFKEKVPLINLAAAADDKSIYDLLSSKGAQPLNARDVLGRSPLHYAAAKGARSMAAEMLQAGIKAYTVDLQGNTPLHLAAMRGQEAMVPLLLEKADKKDKALLTPNKSGLTAYHLALRSGPDDRAQRNSLALIEQLGERFTTPVLGPKKKVVDTPLMLAIQGHQDRVVKALLQKGMSPNERNAAGELPLARVLRCATSATYDNDSAIFDQLMAAGADMSAASETSHPLLALCKNNLSRFAEKVVGVLSERFRGQLNWDKRDDKGYTPLALAAFHDNAWLVRYLIDEIKVDPNSESQRSSPTAPEVVGTTGGLCSSKPITRPGTVPGQTPLMCAAKGASVAAVQLLLNRGADVHTVDSEGRTALQHALQLDKAGSLQVAAALLRSGAHPARGVRADGGQWRPCTDLVGEYWPHRAVRYGVSSFLALWAERGGELDSLLATTADDADDMPGAEIKVEEKTDFLDILPNRVNNIVEAEDEELVDEYNGEDSEQAAAGEDIEGDRTTGAARPVAEGVEAAIASPGDSSEDDCGEEEEEGQGGGDELAALVASGEVESFYEGPTPGQILRWRRRGMQWWDEFWVDRDSLPDMDLEDDPHWEDKYTLCEEGDEWIDEEDVEEEIWERVRAEQRSIANAVRRAREATAAAEQQQQQHPREGADDEGAVTEALLTRVSSGLAHKLFRHRLPNAAVPAEATSGADEGTFASGSPTKWLRRKSSNSMSSASSSPAAADSSPAGPPMTPGSATTTTATTASSSPGASFSSRKAPSPATPAASALSPLRKSSPVAAAALATVATTPAGGGRRSPLKAAAAGPGPVAEAREDLAVVDLEAVSPAAGAGAGRRSQPQPQGSNGNRSLRFQQQPAARGTAANPDSAYIPDPVPQRIVSMGRSQSSKSASSGSSSAASFGKASTAAKAAVAGMGAALQQGGVTGGVNAVLSGGSAALGKSFASIKGKLTAGVSGERLYGNEPYYQPDTLYDGLPRYMDVPTKPFPDAKYDKYVSDLEARVKSYKIKDEKRLEGADLRARNITWYNKSMSPAEYPLKPGKWKSIQRMSAKAVEQARQRRPLKPGEKPQIRKKKVWFGLPNMPSRPELSLTSPLVYAVRLGRVKCVEVLLRVGGGSELVDVPDGHGVTPLSYAMYLLARDRHNKALQQMVDLLLVARPRVDTNELWSGYLRPRMDKQLAALQAAEAGSKGGEGGFSKADKQTLKDLRMMASLFQSQGGASPAHPSPPNYAKLFPSLLNPLILGSLLGDVGRLTYMVQQLGADPNAAWVWLPDIPSYFQGMLEKQLSRCNSRCGPLHVAVCLKQYDVVRSLLDLGFDPNVTGEEYSGDCLKDAAKRAKLAAERRKEVEERKEVAASFNPYKRLWADRPSTLKTLLAGAKRLIASIQIPGFGRPHPWLSPLHLSCRLGQPDITFLLIKRGAAVNGGAASAFASKSPLEEALMYARENAQAYGTSSDRTTYNHILEEACLHRSGRMAGVITEASKQQADAHAALVQQLKAHAERLVAKGVKGKNGKPVTMVDLLAAIRAFEVAGLATYDPASLKYIPVPGANAAVLESKAMKLYSDVMAMMDPVKGAIKAVTLAAKIIIKILLDMMKRPIAYYDPALACAHVMLHFRAPLNMSEKQTGILIRDVLDNSNTLAESSNRRLSPYRWLGIDPATVQDTVWVKSVVNKISVLKANVEYGYMAMDMALSYKEYDKAKKKFMSQVESSIFNIGASSITPHYMRKVLEEIMSSSAAVSKGGGGRAGAAAGGGAGWTPGSLEALLDAMFEQYCTVSANRGKQPGEPPATDAELDQAARDLLPAWLLTAPPPPSAADGAAAPEVVITGQSSRQDVKTFLIKRFVRYTVAGAQPQQYLAPPVPPNMVDLVLQSNDLKHEKPAIPEDALAAVQPTQNDITDADVCTAVVRAHNTLLVQRVQSQSEALRLRTQARQAAAEARRALSRQAGKVSAAVSAQLALAGMTSGQLAFEEGPIFEAAIVDPMWEAAVALLGGSPGVRAMMARLRAAAVSADIPNIPDPLALVKEVLAANPAGEKPDPLAQGPDSLLDGFESQLGRPFPARLRVELARTLSSGGSRGSEGDPEAFLGTISKNMSQLVEAAQAVSDAAGALALLESRFGPRVVPMFRALGQMVGEGGVELPSLDPESLLGEMAEEIGKRGSDAVADVWERRLGKVLPEDVRAEVEKGARDFAEQISKAYAEGGLSAVMANFGDVTSDAAARAGDIVEGGLDRVQSLMEGGMDKMTTAASQLLDGNVSCLLDENGCLALPLPKKLMSGRMGQAVAGALTAAMPGGAADVLDRAAAAGQSVSDATQQVLTDGLAAIDEGQRAMEAALSGGDFTSLAALTKGRMAAMVSGSAALALQSLLADFRSQLTAQGGDVMDAMTASLDRLVNEMQASLEAALAKTQRLAEGVMSAVNGEGWGALAEVLGMDAEQLMDSLKGPEALREGAVAALEALRNGADAGLLDSAGQLLENGVAGDALANGLGAITRSPAARSLLGGFVQRQLLSPKAREQAASTLRELDTASEQFSLGVDLDLSVDVAALFEEQEQFREVLMTMLEMLNIDEMF